MNISHLSQETLTQLVELAIAASPTKAAHILLNNVMVVNAVPMAATPTPIRTVELSWYEQQHREEIMCSFDKIMQYEQQHREEIMCSFDKIMQFATKRDKIGAIKELRTISGIGLKESKDTIEYCFPTFNQIYEPECYTSVDKHWTNLLLHYIKTGEYMEGQ
jgi:ribosomal protein L7/L12